MKIKFQNRKRKRKKRAALSAAIGILCMGMLLIEFIREDFLLETICRQAKNELYLSMLKTGAPSLFFEKQEKSSAKYFMIPVYGYVTDEEEYATQSESEISYESIIAREAMDENYVNEETGEVVLSKESDASELLF